MLALDRDRRCGAVPTARIFGVSNKTSRCVVDEVDNHDALGFRGGDFTEQKPARQFSLDRQLSQSRDDQQFAVHVPEYPALSRLVLMLMNSEARTGVCLRIERRRQRPSRKSDNISAVAVCPGAGGLVWAARRRRT
jgi:hypothetical protein